jgi:hypothetical protein
MADAGVNERRFSSNSAGRNPPATQSASLSQRTVFQQNDSPQLAVVLSDDRRI